MGLSAHAVTDELDVVSDLADEIATLAANIHAATYRLLTLIAEFDRLQGWEPEGHRVLDAPISVWLGTPTEQCFPIE